MGPDQTNLAFLRDHQVADRLAMLPPFLRQVVTMARDSIAAEQVILFGSRARGDAVFGSDFDLAFKKLARHDLWSRFVLDLEVHAKTLQPFDLVWYDEADVALQASIDKEGLILYDAKSSQDEHRELP